MQPDLVTDPYLKPQFRCSRVPIFHLPDIQKEVSPKPSSIHTHFRKEVILATKPKLYMKTIYIGDQARNDLSILLVYCILYKYIP